MENSQSPTGTEPVYGSGAYHLPEYILIIVNSVSGVAVIATVIAVAVYLGQSRRKEATRWPWVIPLLHFMWAFWVLIPPVWFSFEYFYLFKIKAQDMGIPFETFKYGQDTAAKAWLGIAAFLTGVLKV